MSMNSLTNQAVARDVARKQAQMREEASLAASETTASTRAMDVATFDNDRLPNVDSNISGALNALIKYIPTESVALYIAAVNAVPALAEEVDISWGELIYWGFGALTPLLYLLLYMGKRRSAGLPILPQSPKEWPLWSIFASTIAFLAWALAVPDGPYLQSANGGLIAGLLALFVSFMLEIVGRIVGPLSEASTEGAQG